MNGRGRLSSCLGFSAIVLLLLVSLLGTSLGPAPALGAPALISGGGVAGAAVFQEEETDAASTTQPAVEATVSAEVTATESPTVTEPAVETATAMPTEPATVVATETPTVTVTPTERATDGPATETATATEIPATPVVDVHVASVASASLSSTRGTVNSKVAFTLSGFPSRATVAIAWQRTAGSWIDLGSTQVDEQGAGTGSFRVPATPGGTGQVVRFSTTNAEATATYDVVPRIKVTPSSVAPGATVDVSLRGFASREAVRIRWRNAQGSWIEVATATLSGTGSANVDVIVPPWAPVGSNSVRADSAAFAAQTNAVTISGAVTPMPAVTLNPTRGTVNKSIAFTLTGFTPKAAVTISWVRSSGSLITLGSVTADADGAATGSFKIPATPGGAGRVRFSAGPVTVDGTLDVASRIKVTPGEGTVGSTVDVSLRGYAAGESVQIRWRDGSGSFRTMATATMSSTGSKNVAVTVPDWAPTGTNAIRGDGPSFRAQTNAFTVLDDQPTKGVVTSSVTEIRPGSAFTVSISNYPANDTFRANVADSGSTGGDYLGIITTDASGAGSATFVYPLRAVFGGQGYIQVFPPSRNSYPDFVAGKGDIYVLPVVTALPGNGLVIEGTTTSVEIAGVAINSTITIALEGAETVTQTVEYVYSPGWYSGPKAPLGVSSAAMTITIRDPATGRTEVFERTLQIVRDQTRASAVANCWLYTHECSWSVSSEFGEEYYEISLVYPDGSFRQLAWGTTDIFGKATGSSFLPAELPEGMYVVRTQVSGGTYNTTLWVEPEMSSEPVWLWTGLAGQSVTLQLSGYSPNTVVDIYFERWDTDPSLVYVATIVTDAQGTATLQTTIPLNVENQSHFVALGGGVQWYGVNVMFHDYPLE